MLRFSWASRITYYPGPKYCKEWRTIKKSENQLGEPVAQGYQILLGHLKIIRLIRNICRMKQRGWVGSGATRHARSIAILLNNPVHMFIILLNEYIGIKIIIPYGYGLAHLRCHYKIRKCDCSMQSGAWNYIMQASEIRPFTELRYPCANEKCEVNSENRAKARQIDIFATYWNWRYICAYTSYIHAFEISRMLFKFTICLLCLKGSAILICLLFGLLIIHLFQDLLYTW